MLFRSSGSAAHGQPPSRRLFARRGITATELGNLTQELATLLRAGLSLDRSLDLLLGMATHPALREVLAHVRDEVRGGAALSAALESRHEVFGRFYVSMIRAGEAGGALTDVLARIATHMERSRELRETVKSALIYPSILVFVAALSIVLLLTLVVPQFSQMFEESGKALPLATRIVISSGDWLRDWGWTLLLGGLAIHQYFRRALAHPARRLRWDARLLRLPLAGGLILRIEVARLARTLSALLDNGVPLLPALGIVRNTVGNLVLAGGIEAAREELKEGRGFGRPLLAQGIFPPLAVHMIMVGEETGGLATMLGRIAEVYDREVQLSVRRLLALLEPAMILGLGLVIGGIILSILLAILQVNTLVT